MDEYSKVNVKLSDTQLKKTKNCCQRWKKKNSKNEFKNIWWKRFTTWIGIDNKTKSKAKKCF